jgi:predicted permease
VYQNASMCMLRQREDTPVGCVIGPWVVMIFSIYLAPAEPKGCQVPHFSRYYYVIPNVCLGVPSNFMDRHSFNLSLEVLICLNLLTYYCLIIFVYIHMHINCVKS